MKNAKKLLAGWAALSLVTFAAAGALGDEGSGGGGSSSPSSSSASASVSASTPESAPAGDDKKIGVGADAQFMLPVGDLGDSSGPEIGFLVRGGYRVLPPLEITARLGYLFGIAKSTKVPAGNFTQSVDSHLSFFPVWVGARWFFMEPPAGLYAAAELAVNVMTVGQSTPSGSNSKGLTREGVNLGAGYVLSRSLPIDVRAQLSVLNLLGKDTGESTFLAIGLSAGYTFFF